MKILLHRLLFLVPVLAALGAAPSLHAQRERFSPEDMEIIEQRWPGTKRTFTGLRYLVLKEGEKGGGTAQPGMFVAALYKGMLLNGTVFDQSLDPKKPFKVRIGRDELIRGWEEALQKMHRGEKWLLIVPYELGYGTLGRPPAIPQRATLVFEMELVDFGKK
ncbi:MAG: FKBP-type peptidyl-prolyl cis-trans isomerase [Opitutales bacterium]